MSRPMRGDRARRLARKVKPGDGSRLRPYRWWEPFWRSLMTITLPDERGAAHAYAVDVDFFDLTWDLDTRARLYRDGREVAVASTPAVFEVPGGRIEVATSLYGLTRAHLVEDGRERSLTPHPRSGEGWRAALAARRPVLSQIVGGVAIAILVVSLAVSVPQLLAWVSEWEVVAETLGTVEAPFSLPSWVASTLTVAAIAAAVERALALRNHWLLDAETGWIDG